jgi:hypothetical protein
VSKLSVRAYVVVVTALIAASGLGIASPKPWLDRLW